MVDFGKGEGRGATVTARRYYEQALAIMREVGDRAGEGVILSNLGALAAALGQSEQARSYYEQALLILQNIGAVAYARVIADNLASLDAGISNTASGDTPETPASPPEKPLPPKRRRWPWQRKSAQ